MNTFFKNMVLFPVLFVTLQGIAQVNYKITIQGDPLLKNVNGSNVAGETNVRVKIYGEDNQTLLGGKLCIGDFATIIIKDKPDIGNIAGVDIELTGKGWSNPVKINNINVKKEDENGEGKKFSFSCGCMLTQGNSKVEIDEAGPINFNEVEIAAPEFKLDGQFSVEDVSFQAGSGDVKIRGTVSKKSEGSKQATVEQKAVPGPPKMICTEEKVNATAAFDMNFVLNPNESNLFPGAMLYAEDIADGSYSTYASGNELNPIKLTTTIAIIGGNPTITVIDPDLGTVGTAINDLLINQNRGDAPVVGNFEISDISSMEELILKVGAHASGATFDTKLKVDLSNSSKKNIKMIKFIQKFYTLTMVPPNKPTDLFKNNQKAVEALQSGKTPLYVNSIQYGRVAYFFMESDQITKDLDAHFDGEYHGTITAGGSADVQVKKDIASSRYSGTVIGGEGAIPIGGFDDFIDFIKKGGTLSQSSLAVPISYSCKFLADNKQAYVNLFSSYTKRTCTPVKSENQKAVVKLLRFHTVAQSEATSEWGYLFEVKAFNASASLIISNEKAYYTNRQTAYMQLAADGNYDLNVMNSFSFKIADVKNIQLFINANVVEVDGDGDPDDLSPRVEQALYLKDLISADPLVPKENKLTVQFGSEKVEFIYTVTLEDE